MAMPSAGYRPVTDTQVDLNWMAEATMDLAEDAAAAILIEWHLSGMEGTET